ncbi:hypothetical protein ALT721_1800009 [Alteromonas alvinellae]
MLKTLLTHKHNALPVPESMAMRLILKKNSVNWHRYGSIPLAA